MITVILATNRPGNQTEAVALKYCQVLTLMGENVNYFSLENLPPDFLVSDMYGRRSELMQNILNEMFIPATKFVVVAPEYNGTFPGVFKLFIDAIHPEIFYTKKVALVGTSAGRAGNVRGMDHLTNTLNYIQVNVLPYKLPISSLPQLLEGNELKDPVTIQLIEQQAKLLVAF